MVDIFVKGKPVWGEGLEAEINLTLGFYKKITAKEGNAVLKVATAGFYKLYLNGEFLYFGPARCAHGHYRYDEIPIMLQDGENHVALQVVNYYINSFYLPAQKGFIQAEIELNGEILAATGDSEDGFDSFLLNERVRKVQKYSYQRHFVEVYRLTQGFCDWRIGKSCGDAKRIKTVSTEAKKLLPRGIPLNKFTEVLPEYSVCKGRAKSGQKVENYLKDRSLTDVNHPVKGGNYLQGFNENELELILSNEVQEFKTLESASETIPYQGASLLSNGEFEILSFPCEKTGFITADIECDSEAEVYITFDEILTCGDVDPLRMECCNAIKLYLQRGSYRFMSCEPMGFKFLKLLCVHGEVKFENVRIVETVWPTLLVNKSVGRDEAANKILEAARETYIQNSFDNFMDCPTRERAGWLCDSFFLGRAEYEFTGKNIIERNFLENYLLADNCKNIPEGMVPMCYPSDHGNVGIIPNWAMWLVLEVAEYRERTGDTALVSAFRDKIYGILGWFEKYENADGLLERLPGWIFVEWSMANNFVQDINFPSNMLYAKTMECAAKLYGDEALLKRSRALKQTVKERSFDGEFFTDNEVLEDGVAQKTRNRTETCQYYAFFTGVATLEEHGELWKTLVNDFGPDRTAKGVYPEIHPSNAFIGNFLRLLLLERNGAYKQLACEIKGYFLYMAERTGTLWEHIDTHASCNHGFASYVAYLLRAAEENI